MAEPKEVLTSARNFYASYAQALNPKDLEQGDCLCARALEQGVEPREVKLLYLDIAQMLHDRSSSRDDGYCAAAWEFVRKVDRAESMKPDLTAILEEKLPSFISIDRPTETFADVIGLGYVKKEIRRVVVEPFENPEKWRKYFSSDEAKEGIILVGPPGCGKTLLMRAAAGEGNATFIYLKGEEIPDGKEAESIAYVFNLAKKYSPSIVFIDECQAVLNPKRTRFVTPMQKELDGFGKIREHILVVGNTNKPWEIDTTLRRPGRFGTLIFVPPPDMELRAELFKRKLLHKPVSKEVDYKRLADLTEGYSPADITEICRLARKNPYDEDREVTMQDLEQAISARKSSISEWFSLAKGQIEKSDGRREVFGYLLAEIEKYLAAKKEKQSSIIKEVIRK